MNISDHDHENWYGDPIKAAKMSGTDYHKKYYNNLKSLMFNFNNNMASGFNLASFIKYK